MVRHRGFSLRWWFVKFLGSFWVGATGAVEPNSSAKRRDTAHCSAPRNQFPWTNKAPQSHIYGPHSDYFHVKSCKIGIEKRSRKSEREKQNRLGTYNRVVKHFNTYPELGENLLKDSWRWDFILEWSIKQNIEWNRDKMSSVFGWWHQLRRNEFDLAINLPVKSSPRSILSPVWVTLTIAVA